MGEQEPRKPLRDRMAKKPERRNVKYKKIDAALQEIAESRPCTQEEIFRSLDGSKLAVPAAEPFVTARDGSRDFAGRGSRPRMALEEVGGVEPVAFAPRTENSKKYLQ